MDRDYRKTIFRKRFGPTERRSTILPSASKRVRLADLALAAGNPRWGAFTTGPVTV